MGFAAGVMVAASCWSLLIPAIDTGGVAVATIGLVGGAAFLYVADQVLPHLHGEFPDEAQPEGPRVAWQRSLLLMIAMTLHNFPEGMAVGISFGGGDVGSATALAIGIGLQNIPELRLLGRSTGEFSRRRDMSSVFLAAAALFGGIGGWHRTCS